MALLARPHLPRSNALTLLAAGALLLASAALAGVLSTVQVPSSATYGLPADWGQRAAWLAVEALAGLAIACALLGLRSRRTPP